MEVTNPKSRDSVDDRARLVYQKLQNKIEEDDSKYDIFINYLRDETKFDASCTVRLLDQKRDEIVMKVQEAKKQQQQQSQLRRMSAQLQQRAPLISALKRQMSEPLASNTQTSIFSPGIAESASEASSSPFSVDNRVVSSPSSGKPVFNFPDEFSGSDVEMDLGTNGSGEYKAAHLHPKTSNLSSKRKLESEIEISSKKYKALPSKRDYVSESFAIQIFKQVSKFWSLGSILGLPYFVTDDIESSYQPNEHAIEVAQACVKRKMCYEDLYCSLQNPAVQDKAAAELVKQECPTVSTTRTSSDSSDITTDGISSKPTESDDSISEGNVLEVIESVSDTYELGINLGLSENTLKEIEKYPPLHQKQKLVSRFFRITGKSEVDWELINKAIAQTRNRRASGRILSEKADKLAESDSALIMGRFSRLKSRIRKELEKKRKEEEDVLYDIKERIRDMFEHDNIDSEISEANSVEQIFEKLDKYKMWNYQHTAKLFVVAKEFLRENKDLMDNIKEYKRDFVAHEKCTSICDWLSENPHVDISSQDPNSYPTAFRKELTWKFLESEEIYKHCLPYLKEVWEELPLNFDKLEPVLDKIREGCIEVVWYIPSVVAQTLLNNIQLAISSLQKSQVSEVYLETVSIFDGTNGIASEQEQRELHLLLAVQDKCEERTQNYIEQSKCINRAWSEMRRTLLMIASHGGCIKIVSMLLDHGAEVNQQDGSGWTALAYAAVQREMDVMNILLEKEADISIQSKNPGSITVLDLMKKLNKQDVYDFLLEQYFIKSAKRGDVIAVHKTLELLVNMEATEKDEHGWNALLWACYKGHEEIVQLLLEHKALPNAKSKTQWTGVALATSKGFLKIVKNLLENGADPNSVTNGFWSPLLFAADGNYPEIAKLLIEHGGISISDKAGLTPLSQSCQLGHFEVVKVLVEHDKTLDINKPTELGWSPLQLAALGGYKDIVCYLNDHGADLAYIKKDNSNALHIACCKGYESLARYLCLQRKINVDQQDSDGLTPLMFAACLGYYQLARVLVENGRANLNVYETNNEWSALYFAVEGGHLDLMKYLLSTKRVDLLHQDVKGNTLFELAEHINKDAYDYLKKNHSSDLQKVERKDPLIYAKIFKDQEIRYYEPMVKCVRKGSELKVS